MIWWGILIGAGSTLAIYGTYIISSVLKDKR